MAAQSEPANASRPARLKSWVLGQAVALASVAGALVLTRSIQSVFPTPLFFAGIVISTWYGGAISGLLAVALATVARSILRDKVMTYNEPVTVQVTKFDGTTATITNQ